MLETTQLRAFARLAVRLVRELPPMLRWMAVGVLLAGGIYLGWTEVTDEAAREVLDDGTGEGSE